MKISILFLLCFASLNVMGQGTITRKKQQSTTQTKSKPAPKPKSTSRPKSTPKPAPQKTIVEDAGYDVTFTCNVPSAILYIDGTANGNASGSRFLKTGSHTIRLTADGYEDYTQNVTVGQSSQSFSLEMKKIDIQASYSNGVLNVNGVEYCMVNVVGGTFTMGGTSAQDRDVEDEKPIHNVTLSSYYIGQTEVTQELWMAIMKSNPSEFIGYRKPVDNVSWEDCYVFISRLNSITGKKFRLPTEAEWEYACRGGRKSKGYKYSGGNDLKSVAWFKDNSDDGTSDVAQKSPNELGLYDMSGNVYEWCNDWYGPYSNNPQTNPSGANSGSDKIYRGGSWVRNSWDCRFSNREYHYSEFRNADLGFRLALSQ